MFWGCQPKKVWIPPPILDHSQSLWVEGGGGYHALILTTNNLHFIPPLPSHLRSVGRFRLFRCWSWKSQFCVSKISIYTIIVDLKIFELQFKVQNQSKLWWRCCKSDILIYCLYVAFLFIANSINKWPACIFDLEINCIFDQWLVNLINDLYTYLV